MRNTDASEGLQGSWLYSRMLWWVWLWSHAQHGFCVAQSEWHDGNGMVIVSLYKCIAGNRSSAIIRLPQWQNNYVDYFIIWKWYWKPCPILECLAGKCEAHLAPIKSVRLPLMHDWCRVRTPTPPLSLACQDCQDWSSTVIHSSVPWIAVAETCGSLIGSHSSTPSVPSTTPTRKRKDALNFRLSLCIFSVRSLGCLELFFNSN
jgi:hypothetical protein